MKIVILEDEKPSANKLCSCIEHCQPDATIVAVLESVRQAAKWFDNNPMPDLIISDIQLLDDNVFTLFGKISISCPIIFVTAYDDYFKLAFDTNGIAYLLKPITREEVAASLKKYALLKSGFNSQLLQQFTTLFPANKYKQRFAIKAPGGFFLLETTAISFIRSKDGFTWAYSGPGKKHLLNETLTELEALLDPGMFFRINRSEIVNIRSIHKFSPNDRDGLTIHLSDHHTSFDSSAGRTAALKKWLIR